MTLNAENTNSTANTATATNDIYLDHYVRILMRRKVEIAGVMVAAIAIAVVGILIYRLMTPPEYEATATATIMRTFTNVQFDSRFTTSSESVTTESSSNSVDSRRAALVALAKSSSIAQQVIDQLGDALPLDLQNASDLLKSVDTEMATNGRSIQSDLINFNVVAPSSQLAADIANAWAAIYVQQVNSVYGQVPDDMLESVAAQLIDARTAYADAQADLEASIATSRIDSLSRQITTTVSTLEKIQTGKADALDAYLAGLVSSYSRIIETYVSAQAEAQMLAFNKEQEGNRQRVSAYLDAYNAAQVETFIRERDNAYAELSLYYEQWRRTDSLLSAARTLQEQIAEGVTTTAGSALAVQALNLQVVNNGADLSPVQFQVAATNSTADAGAPPADLRSQVDAIVASLASQITTLEQKIDQLNQSLRSGNNFEELNAVVPADSELRLAIAAAYPALFQTGVFSTTEFQSAGNDLLDAGQVQATRFLNLLDMDELPTTDAPDAPMSAIIVQLEDQLRLLQEQLEVETARKLQFMTERDLAWSSVEALGSKQAELQLARAAANSEVRLSSAAVPLDEPLQTTGLLMSALLAAVVGLGLGVALAFVLEANGTR